MPLLCQTTTLTKPSPTALRRPLIASPKAKKLLHKTMPHSLHPKQQWTAKSIPIWNDLLPSPPLWLPPNLQQHPPHHHTHCLTWSMMFPILQIGPYELDFLNFTVLGLSGHTWSWVPHDVFILHGRTDPVLVPVHVLDWVPHFMANNAPRIVVSFCSFLLQQPSGSFVQASAVQLR